MTQVAYIKLMTAGSKEFVLLGKRCAIPDPVSFMHDSIVRIVRDAPKPVDIDGVKHRMLCESGENVDPATLGLADFWYTVVIDEAAAKITVAWESYSVEHDSDDELFHVYDT